MQRPSELFHFHQRKQNKSIDQERKTDKHTQASKQQANLNQTNNQTDGHWYGTFSTYMILGVARTSDYVSFITGRGHEVRLVRQEDDGSQWEVLYIQPGQAPRYLAEEEDEGVKLKTITRPPPAAPTAPSGTRSGFPRLPRPPRACARTARSTSRRR